MHGQTSLRTPPKPTDAELAILRVLWRRGPATVRAIHDELGALQDTGYTTALKLLQIMTEKGLVRRDESARSHIYEAQVGEAEVQQQLVGHLLDRAFGGSASQLVLQALSSRRATPDELAEIRHLIEEMEARA